METSGVAGSGNTWRDVNGRDSGADSGMLYPGHKNEAVR